MTSANAAIDEVDAASPVQGKWICGAYGSIKPMLDYALAAVLLLIFTPIILLAMVLVRLNSRGPAIYTQRRVGFRGKVFTMYKIRTMYLDSEQASGPRWCVPGDPRITLTGRFLRWSH